MARSEQRQALSHPVRLAILDLYNEDTERSLAVDVLLGDLRKDSDLSERHPLAFRNLDAARVKYHLARLQDVNLLPADGQ